MTNNEEYPLKDFLLDIDQRKKAGISNFVYVLLAA